jgi:hypothetical protein
VSGTSGARVGLQAVPLHLLARTLGAAHQHQRSNATPAINRHIEVRSFLDAHDLAVSILNTTQMCFERRQICGKSDHRPQCESAHSVG